jgi:hypothetical protein
VESLGRLDPETIADGSWSREAHARRTCSQGGLLECPSAFTSPTDLAEPVANVHGDPFNVNHLELATMHNDVP